MKSEKKPASVPSWQEGRRVRLTRKGHSEFQKTASIVAVLPNPSGRPQSQWYDVRFDDGRYGRFLQRYLELADSLPGTKSA